MTIEAAHLGFAAALTHELAEGAQHRRTGILTVTRGKQRTLICLERGRLVFAASNVIEHQLLAFLEASGQLDAAARTALAADAAESGIKPAQLLLDSGRLGADALATAVAAHVRRIVYTTLDWKHGELAFDDGRPNLAGEVTVDLSCAEMLVGYVRDHIPSLAEVRQGLGAQSLRPLFVESRRPLYAECALGPLGEYLEKRCDGTVPLAEVVGKSPQSPETTLRVVFGMLLLGIVIPYRETRSQERREMTEAVSVDEIMARFKRVEDADSYGVLELTPAATRDEVREAYYFLARRYHPDRFRNGPLQGLLPAIEGYFTRVTEAYNNLFDPVLRAEYDKKRTGDEPAPKTPEPEQDRGYLARQNFARAKILVGKGRYTDAVTFLENAVELDPGQAPYHRALGELLIRNPRRRSEAERHLQRSIQLEPSRFEAYLALGELYVKLGRIDEAETNFQEVLRWEPGNLEALAQLKALEQGGGSAGGRLRDMFKS